MTDVLPAIPQKRYFTIGEVAQLCRVKPHVLRYWEQEFPQLKPSKRRGNRRYYQYKDVLMIRQIYDLLYGKGYTISGARQYMVSDRAQAQKLEALPQSATSVNQEPLQQCIRDTIEELEAVLETLR